VNSDRLITPEEWTRRAAAYQSASYIDAAQVQQMVKDLVQTMPNLDQAPLFTDDYAPIETMTF
jgi:hypothetical protein